MTAMMREENQSLVPNALRSINNAPSEMNAELPTPQFPNDFTSLEYDGKSDGMLKTVGLKNLLFQRLYGFVDDGVE